MVHSLILISGHSPGLSAFSGHLTEAYRCWGEIRAPRAAFRSALAHEGRTPAQWAETRPNDGHLTAILDAQKLSLTEPEQKFLTMSVCVTANNMFTSFKKSHQKDALVKQSLPILCQRLLAVRQGNSGPAFSFYATVTISNKGKDLKIIAISFR